MANFGLIASHRGLGVVIGIHMLLNISLVGSRGILKVLAFLLGLAGRHFLKPNPRLRSLDTYFSNLRLLISTNLGI